jgi:hypothetical protein
MSKKSNLDELTARVRLDSAALWVDVISKGLGQCLLDRFVDDADDLKAVFDVINHRLIVAVEELAQAREAYRPFRRRLRRRYRATAVAEEKPPTVN